MLLDATCVADVRERIVAIVKFGPPTESDGLRPGEFYQVTVDPERFSPCGEYIRFGGYDGDELIGWQRAYQIFIVAELTKWPMSVEVVQIPWGESPALHQAQFDEMRQLQARAE